MRFLLVSQGTRGDVQPFVALAQALEERGHDVILAAPQWVSELLENQSIHHFILSDIEQELMADNAVCVGFETNYSGLRGKKLFVDVIRRYRIVSEKIISEFSGFLNLDVDAVVHEATLPAHEVAEAIGVPAVPVCVEPSYVPTNQFPDPILPFRIPRFLNSISYVFARRWAQVVFRNTDKWRAEVLKLPHRQGHKNPFRQPDGTPSHVLQAFSKEVLPPAVNYPDWVHTTGFWFLSRSKPWQLPTGLSDFLSSNDASIFLGFGSLATSDPTKREEVLADAIDLANVPAVVVGGSGGLSVFSENSSVFNLQDAPYDWLFPRMSTIVHHGGSGTSSFALSTGRPQVVCPAVYAQSFNARQMYRIGVATKPLPQRQLSAKALAEAIKRSISDRSIAACAKRMSHRIQSESGVSKAADVLESLTDK